MRVAELFRRFSAEYAAQNYGSAYRCFRDALHENAAVGYRYFVARASAAVVRTVSEVGAPGEVVSILDTALVGSPLMSLMCDDDLDSIHRYAAVRELNIDRGLPSVVLVTQRKSASVSVARIFHGGFHLPSVAYSLVSLEVIETWARDYARGGACYVTHLEPKAINIARLRRAGMKKVIVHVRDPRQSLLSMIHHISRYPDQDGGRAARMQLATMSIEEQVDEVWDFYVDVIRWIECWLDAQSELEILFSTFEEFANDKKRFIDRYLAFYGGSSAYFSRENALSHPTGSDFHYRNGSTDEWRYVFPKAVRERVSAWLPERLRKQFNWAD